MNIESKMTANFIYYNGNPQFQEAVLSYPQFKEVFIQVFFNQNYCLIVVASQALLVNNQTSDKQTLNVGFNLSSYNLLNHV